MLLHIVVDITKLHARWPTKQLGMSSKQCSRCKACTGWPCRELNWPACSDKGNSPATPDMHTGAPARREGGGRTC